MRIKSFQTAISFLISLLLSYGMFSFHKGSNNLLLLLGSLIFLFGSLITLFGIDFQTTTTTINIKTVAIIAFIIALISNLIFTFLNFSSQSYITINGILFLIFLLIFYSIQNSNTN